MESHWDGRLFPQSDIPVAFTNKTYHGLLDDIKKEGRDMKEVRIGIIGTGMVSNQHMQRYKNIPNATVVAACDIDKPKLDAWCSHYGVNNAYTDFREMLKRDDIDAVDVCLHNNLHTPISIAVMKAGKNCYCEKPMAGSYADAKVLYNASKSLGQELSIHLDFLFQPAGRIARQMIDNGQLGKIYHARSVGYRRRMRPGLDIWGQNTFSPDFITSKWAGHGALYDMGVYRISHLLYIMGVPKLERVSGATYSEVDIDPVLLKNRKFEVEELGVGFAKYENGLTLDVLESWAIHMDDFGTGFVVGSKGGIRFCKSGDLKFMNIMDGRTVETDIRIGENEGIERVINPVLQFNENDQTHWIAYLSGQITERIDTAWIALQTMLISEGIFLSGKLNREVTADEIEGLSVSNAVRRQETPFGVLDYEF